MNRTPFDQAVYDSGYFLSGRERNIAREFFVRGSNIIATGTEALVCSDINERQQKGIIKYKSTVAENPLELKQWLQHAYEEALDMAIYLKRAITELEDQSK